MELSEVHDCEKSHGKIVVISIDNLGVTRCDYCNQVVDYSKYFRMMDAEIGFEKYRMGFEKLKQEEVNEKNM